MKKYHDYVSVSETQIFYWKFMYDHPEENLSNILFGI